VLSGKAVSVERDIRRKPTPNGGRESFTETRNLLKNSAAMTSALAVPHANFNMPKWILICKKCEFEFEHSQVDDMGMSSLYLLARPEVPPAGNKCVCPNCGFSGTYRRTDLLYRL
jgi:hypothetical protein